ncbi:O-antigen ligase family protein [Derxia gummosa]|uniref:O-antigen ligase family protein n=1 Tax=Derxia gummosa DSM 723 TaxID=1121388 RepID=A0A8B6X356_9BURK|nr:O-antigen ligase family protein [Derxia gummosa]
MPFGFNLTHAALLALTLFPALVLTVRHSSNACLFVLVLLAIARAVTRRQSRPLPAIDRRYRWFVLALAAYPVFTLARMLAASDHNGAALDTTLRYLLAAGVFGFIARIDSRRLQLPAWGFAAGAVGAAVAGWIGLHLLRLERGTLPFVNAIPFGNMALLLGYVALLSCFWGKPTHPLRRLAGSVGLACGLFASLLSESRGGWLTLPLFLLALLASLRLGRLARAGIVALALAAGAGAYLGNDIVRHRVEMAQSDLAELDKGNANTSTGIRLALWQAAWRMGTEHPLFGVGRGRFQPTLAEYAREGRLDPALTDKRHAHNDFLNHFAETGAVGLLVLLGIYLVPGALFLRAARRDDALLAGAGRAGLLVCASYLVFGLTESMLAVTMNAAFHALTLTWLMALVARREAELTAVAAPADAVARQRRQTWLKRRLLPLRIALARLLWWVPARPAGLGRPGGPMVFLRWDGKLGDFVVSGFLYGELKRRFGCEIAVVVAPGQEALYRELPGVDHVVDCRRRHPVDVLRAALALRRLGAQYCVELNDRARWSDLLFMRVLGARVNLKGAGPAFNQFQLLDLPDDGRVVDRYRAFLRHFGIEAADWRFDWPLTDDARAFARDAFTSRRARLVINPFGASPLRSLSAARVAEVANDLRADGEVVILVPPGNDGWRDAIRPLLRDGARLCATTDIRQSAAVIAAADLVISPDTSIAHIAALHSRPLVALYQPQPDNLARWTPDCPALELLVAAPAADGSGQMPVDSIAGAEIVAAARRLLAAVPPRARA